jgi:hypothetical protein
MNGIVTTQWAGQPKNYDSITSRTRVLSLLLKDPNGSFAHLASY